MRVIAVVSKKPRLAGVLFCVYRGIRDEVTRLALPVIWFSEESTVGNMIGSSTTDVNLCFFFLSVSSPWRRILLLSSPEGVNRCQTGLLMRGSGQRLQPWPLSNQKDGQGAVFEKFIKQFTSDVVLHLSLYLAFFLLFLPFLLRVVSPCMSLCL